MTDCPNAEVRDLLPDLLNGTLAGAQRSFVEAHLAGCVACSEELAVLREIREATRATPALDLAAITAAVPAYRAVRPSRHLWRIAAAAVVLLGGGAASMMLLRDRPVAESPRVAQLPHPTPPQPSNSLHDSAAIVAPHATVNATVARGESMRVARAAAVPLETRELAIGGSGLSDLSDRELAALLKSIDELDAVPSTDVEAASLAPATPRRRLQ